MYSVSSTIPIPQAMNTGENASKPYIISLSDPEGKKKSFEVRLNKELGVTSSKEAPPAEGCSCYMYKAVHVLSLQV